MLPDKEIGLMGKDDKIIEQLVATKKRTGKSHTASVSGLNRLSPETINSTKPVKGPRIIRVTLKDIQAEDKKINKRGA